MLKWLIYAKHWKASTGHTYRSRTDEAQAESLSQSVLKEDEERKTEKTKPIAKLFALHANAIRLLEAMVSCGNSLSFKWSKSRRSFYKQHFYKQHQANIGKKLSES